MNWDMIEADWPQFRGRVKARWGKLSQEHLFVIAGKRVELAGRIQEAYGVSRDEAERQVKDFESRNKDYHAKKPHHAH